MILLNSTKQEQNDTVNKFYQSLIQRVKMSVYK